MDRFSVKAQVLAAVFTLGLGVASGCGQGSNGINEPEAASPQFAQGESLKQMTIEIAEANYRAAHPGFKGSFAMANEAWALMQPATGRPGFIRLHTGEIVAAPPDSEMTAQTSVLPESVGGGSPTPTPTPTPNPCPSAASNSSGTPPPCTNTGAFRRVFSSNSGWNFADGSVALPQAFPTSFPTGDTGYVFYEAWPLTTAYTENVEAGLIYSPATGRYVAYQSGPGASWEDMVASYRPNQSITLAFGVGSVPPASGAEDIAVIGNADNCPDKSNPCIDLHEISVADFVGQDCCILARMTTIAQGNGDNFTDGANFGPIGWLKQQMCCPIPGELQLVPWALGGYQSWPNDPTRVIVNLISASNEYDTINLHG